MSGDPRLTRAQAHQVAGELDAAEHLYRAVLAERAGDPQVLALLGFLDLQRERFADAARSLRAAREHGNDDPALHLNLGFALLRAGEHDAAVRTYAEATRRAAHWPAAWNGLGVALQECGRLDEATDAFSQAWRLAPTSADAPANLAGIASARGRHDEAASLYARALAIAPGEADLLMLRGEALAAASRWREAERCFAEVIEQEPSSSAALFALGCTLDRQGRLPEAADAYARAAESDPAHVDALVNLGIALREAGQDGDAADVLARAAGLRPGDPDIERARRAALSKLLPPWHFRMLADDARNAAYRRAIERAVRPGMLVLDIGTGSGLLAMMAARAGAERVVACEASTVVAEAARDVVRDNGLDDRIDVVPLRSTALEVGTHLPRRADLLVSEIVDVGLLGEGALPTVRHARAELLADDAVVIPRAATVYARLVSLPTLRPVNPLEHREGFDLSAFDRFRVPGDYLDLAVGSVPHRWLSDDLAVARFDLARPPAAETRRVPIEFTATVDGTVHAVAFWFDLELDDVERISTRPGEPQFAWGQAVQFLDRDHALRGGERLRVEVLIGDTGIQVVTARGSATAGP